MLKDLQIAGRLAQALELELRVTEAARDAQLDEMKYGHGDEDYSCVARKYFPEGMPSELKEPEPAAVSEPEPVPTEEVLPNASELEPAAGDSHNLSGVAENPSVAQTAVVAPVGKESETPRNFFGRLFHRGEDH
jgi:hypothetical protein